MSGEPSPEDAPGSAVLLIPAYRPTAALLELVAKARCESVIRAVVVVNDGSGPAFEETFATLAAMESVRVLRHLVNLGKGAALKTGLNYAGCNFPEAAGVVTADADGQHAAGDVIRLATVLVKSPRMLVMGTRQFPPHIPFRSRFGNLLTRGVMRAVTGQRISDTQSGLRGIPMDFVPALLRIPQNGYDFELEMLLRCRREPRGILEVPIDTIYLDGNRSSHFNPLLDSMRIYFLFLRFSAVSLSTAALDNLVFLVAFRLLPNVLVSQCLGRLVAGLFNYYLNKSGVFHSQARNARTAPRYIFTVLFFGALSYSLIRLLVSVGLSVQAAKLSSEGLLFAFSFIVQRDFVFFAQNPSAQK